MRFDIDKYEVTLLICTWTLARYVVTLFLFLQKTYQECKKIAGDSYFEKVQRIIELPLQVFLMLWCLAIVPHLVSWSMFKLLNFSAQVDS